jgi:hypothetical protein
MQRFFLTKGMIFWLVMPFGKIPQKIRWIVSTPSSGSKIKQSKKPAINSLQAERAASRMASFVDLLFGPEDGGNMLLRNFCGLVSNYTVLQLTR